MNNIIKEGKKIETQSLAELSGEWAVAFRDQGMGHGTYGVVVKATNKLVIGGLPTRVVAEMIVKRWNCHEAFKSR